ncbi:hypothetical protein P8452_42652 [Trifolium repens]|nr:hypothetical protein P8452_42652 [Trifolium repens]
MTTVYILLAYLSTPRREGPEVDRDVAQKDAKSTEWRTFGCGHSLKKAIKNEASGNFDHALLTISECATYPPKYFAKIHYALHVHVRFEIDPAGAFNRVRVGWKGTATEQWLSS